MKKQDRGPAALTTLEVLKMARARVSKGWCQHWFHRWRDGEIVAWCVRGALADSCGDHYSLVPALRFFESAIDSEYISGWNDASDRTQAEVLAAFDRAIELASAASDPKGPPESASPLAAPKEDG